MEEIEETEADKYNNIIIVNEDGLDNCLVGFDDEEEPKEVFPPIINYYRYKYKSTKDSDRTKDPKFQEKLNKCINQFKLEESLKSLNLTEEALKSLNINLTKENDNTEKDEDEIEIINKVKSISPFDEFGNIQNWDDINFLWEKIFTQKLGVSPEKYNVLLTEGINNKRENREKMAQIMFETFHVPNLYIAKKLVLPIYSKFKLSGLMIYFGNDTITIAPVFEGFCLHPVETFEIPLYSPFFAPNIIDKCAECIRSFDFDIRKELTNCIYLYGTPSKIQRISEQISHKFYYMYGDSTKTKGISEQFTQIMKGLIPSCYEYVDVSVLPEKGFPIWEGAKNFSNMLSENNWISRNEYEEFGSVVVHRKCF